MNPANGQLELTLVHKALFSVSDAADVVFQCRQGCIWLTLDSDSRDIVLRAGEHFQTTEHRHAIIYAIEASEVAMRTVQVGKRQKPTALSRSVPTVSFTLEPSLV